ncbi:MAG: 30S ribosomal protein S18 [Deltaproteobacteria bacterium]|nr:30S ribosomal protein S18 [Deltaproteobacteria bacterium]
MVNLGKLSLKKRRALQRRRVCRFCADATLGIDYKETKLLSQFTTERGKIIPRRISGNCAKHQRAVTLAVKRARHIALMPYASATLN